MQMDHRVNKTRGRLSRDDQRRLGDILHRVYDSVVKEGVPSRFEDLLKQLDETRVERKHQGGADPQGAPGLSAAGTSRSAAAEHAVSAKSFDKPEDKGSSS